MPPRSSLTMWSRKCACRRAPVEFRSARFNVNGDADSTDQGKDRDRGSWRRNGGAQTVIARQLAIELQRVLVLREFRGDDVALAEEGIAADRRIRPAVMSLPISVASARAPESRSRR